MLCCMLVVFGVGVGGVDIVLVYLFDVVIFGGFFGMVVGFVCWIVCNI